MRINSKELLASTQQMRMYIGSHYELTLDMEKLLTDLLVLIIDAPADTVKKLQGEVMLLLIELQNRDFNHEIKELVSELQLKIIRTYKTENKIIRGNDNTDIYKNKRDKDGYITDFSILVPPYQNQRIEHRTGEILHYTEEIYIDAMGRYFRKIFQGPKEDETKESIAKGILDNFTDTPNNQI